LPMLYTKETLRHTIARVKQASEILERPLMLENPSTYAEFAGSTITEWDYLAQLSKEADCGILLDINNVYVSSFNHGFDAYHYIDSIPPDRVVQYHVAGHTNKGTHIIDTHSDHVVDDVWRLYNRSHKRTGARATLLEWDEAIPEFNVVHSEVLKAEIYRKESMAVYAK
jgi:uncharacterized protein